MPPRRPRRCSAARSTTPRQTSPSRPSTRSTGSSSTSPSERPLLLAIDDLQWCDRASLRFIAYLAARLDGQPVLLAATLRSGEHGSDPVLLGEISEAPATESVRPAPLSAAAVAGVVRERLGDDADDAFAAACHEATGGNPLLLGQLLSALAAEALAPRAGNVGRVSEIGSQAIARTVQGRLARMPGDAAAVARAVAILGDGAELATITAFSGLSDQAVAEAAGTLAKAEHPDRPAAARVRPPARARRRPPAAVVDRARARARARRRRDDRAGRLGRAGRRAAADDRAARRAVGRRAAARRRRGRRRRGLGRRRRLLPAARARRAGAGEGAAAAAAGAGDGGGADERPGCGRPPARGARRSG